MKVRAYSEEDRRAVRGIFATYWTDQEFLAELAASLGASGAHFLVAEKDGAVVGVAGWREAPAYLRAYAATDHPAELYVVAAAVQNEGIGSALVQKIIDAAIDASCTELVCYSPETLSSSWPFYERLGFARHGIITDPDDGCPGMLWRKVIP